jgi:hypothetical protein
MSKTDIFTTDLADWQSRDPRRCQCGGRKTAEPEKPDEGQADEAQSSRETIKQFDKAVYRKMDLFQCDRKTAIAKLAHGTVAEKALYESWLAVVNANK